MSFLWDWHAAHYAKKAGLKCFYIPAPESYQIIPTSVSCHHSHHFEWHYSMWVEIFIVLYMLSNSGLLPRHFEIGNSGSYTLCWFGMLSHVQLFAVPWTVACMEFSRLEYWVGCHFLLQGIFPTQRLNLRLFCPLHWQVDSLPLAWPGKHPIHSIENINIFVLTGNQPGCNLNYKFQSVFCGCSFNVSSVFKALQCC